MTVVAQSSRALTERSAVELAAAIRSGELTSREVVLAHAELLHRVQPRTNAIARDRFQDALRDAEAADERIASEDPSTLPPLLGVPCTIKESIALEGMPNCAGLVERRDYVCTETAPAAARLIAAGAIPLGVTNISELTMWIESENRVYGRTRNAYDPHRTAGGSSGGEGAAVGSGGTPIGLGSDIGGSIRLPAFFNGVFGHKASPGTVPNTGQFPNAEGDATRLLTIGPLVRRAEDLMPVLRLIAGPDGVDPRCVDRPLGDPDDVEIAGLDVIVSDDAGIVPLRGEMRDARDRAADALSRAGAHVRTESLRSLRRALELYLAALSDGAGVAVADLVTATHGERRWRDAVRGRGPHTVATMLLLMTEKANGRLPASRTRKLVAAGRSLADEIAGVLGDGVMLHHPFARVAPRHGRTVGRAWVITPAATFNLLGLPVTQVPLGLGAKSRLPTGVQVAAAPGADHRTIAVALELEKAFGGWVPPPR